MLVNPRNIKRLRTALDKGTISPVYYNTTIETLEGVFSNYRRPLKAMQSIPEDFTLKVKNQFKKEWKMHGFMLIPAYIRGRLYIIVPAMRTAGFKKQLPVLERIRFKEKVSFLKHLLIPSQLVQSSVFTVSSLKAKKIPVANAKDFGADVKFVKKMFS